MNFPSLFTGLLNLYNRGKQAVPYLAPQFQKATGPSPISTGKGFSLPGIPSYNPRTAMKRPVSNSSRRSGFGKNESNVDNPLGDLYETLMQMLTSSPGGVGDLSGQIDPAFDARRAAIEGMISRAQGRVGEGREDIESMYEALGQDYERLAPEAKAQADVARQEVEQLYGQLKSNIEGNYSRISDEQSELMQQLGIEAAAPDVLNPQSEQAAASMSTADELGAINQQRYMDMGNIDQSYYRQGAPLARLQGSNLSADLLRQLEDYTAEREADIVSLEADRTSSHAQLAAQARAQQASQQASQTQMLWQILRDTMQGQEQVELNPQSFLGSLPPGIQQSAINTIRAIEKSEPVKTGQSKGQVAGTFVSTPETYYLDALDDMYNQGQIDPVTYQALMQYFRLAGVGVGFGG